MAKTKISEFSSTPANNTDIDSINIAEGCAPSGINDAIRELMAQLKDFQTGAQGDSFNGPVGTTTAAAGAFTNITASGTLGVTGVATLGAGAILNTPASVTLTNATGLPISTGVSGLGTGVATALAVNTGSSGAVVVNGGALGTPSSGTVTNLTGTASININGTVGATTPTTGAFTTLTTSSTITDNGGTANGVTYLNASKVVTSGSALTFSGSNLGIGIASASQRLHVYESTSSTGAFLQTQEVGGQNAYFGVNTSGGSIQVSGANPLQFAINGSEQMRLTSTGLGIGTSSPQEKLTVAGAVQVTGVLSSLNRPSSAVTDFLSGSTRFFSIGANSSTYGSYSFRVATTTANTEVMAIDSSGNLGLGVTPSAWGGSFKAYQTTGGAIAGNSTNNIRIFQNSYFNGTNYVYVATEAASRYDQQQGNHAWFNAASGTAGTAISFTQAMTLDASGQLGIGTTSPGTKLDVQVSNPTRGLIARIQNSATSSQTGSQLWFNQSAVANWVIGQPAGTDAFAFWNGRADNSDGTERARIDSSGNLLIGTTTANSKLYVVGTSGYGHRYTGAPTDLLVQQYDSTGNASINNQANAILSFATNNTERVRITSSGYFKASNTGSYLGVTTSSHEFRSNADGNYAVTVSTSATTPFGVYVGYTASAPNNTTSRFIDCEDTGGFRFQVRSNGGIANYQANDVNLSDRREKTNFAPAKSYLDTICAIPVQTFNYIDQNMEDDDGLTLGVVAQDVQAVAPELVMESNWGTKEEPKMRLSIYQTDLQYALMKALQELKAEFDAYKASHP